MSGMCMVPVGLLTQATQSAEESGDSLNSQQQIWLSAFNISRKWACDIIQSVFRTRTWKRSLQEVVCLCVWGRVHAVVWHLPRITTGWRTSFLVVAMVDTATLTSLCNYSLLSVLELFLATCTVQVVWLTMYAPIQVQLMCAITGTIGAILWTVHLQGLPDHLLRTQGLIE